MNDPGLMILTLFCCIVIASSEDVADLCHKEDKDFITLSITIGKKGNPGQIVEKCDSNVNIDDVSDKPLSIKAPGKLSENKLYTLLMVDPDAPFPEAHTHRFWLHWMITNIKATDLNEGKFPTGTETEVVDYAPPSPPSTSSFHRYQFYLYEQTDPKKTVTHGGHKDARGNFGVKKWAEENKLKLIGGFQYRTKQEQ